MEWIWYDENEEKKGKKEKREGEKNLSIGSVLSGYDDIDSSDQKLRIGSVLPGYYEIDSLDCSRVGNNESKSLYTDKKIDFEKKTKIRDLRVTRRIVNWRHIDKESAFFQVGLLVYVSPIHDSACYS